MANIHHGGCHCGSVRYRVEIDLSKPVTQCNHHLFCKRRGVRPFARGQGAKGPMVAINTRCLDDLDPGTLNVQHFDGKSRQAG